MIEEKPGQKGGKKNDGEKKKEWQLLQKEAKQMFEVITGQLHYPARPFHDSDLQPDLIIRWRVPQIPQKQKIAYVKRNKFQPVSAFVSVPSPQLEEAFAAAQAKIMNDMQQAKENLDNKEVRFRLMASLEQMKKPQNNTTKIVHSTGEEEPLQLECLDQKLQALDGFSLQFNSVVYILQQQCGFNVRAFMIKGEQRVQNQILTEIGVTKLMDTFGIEINKRVVRDIYLFLNLSTDNMLKVAARFAVKKAINYTALDFSLNDPCTGDDRPYRFNSKFINSKQFLTEMKHVSRFFRAREQNATNSQIIDERVLTLSEEQRFLSYWEQITLIFHFFKYMLDSKVSNQEKVYLHEYNRGKLNPGCEKLFSRMKKAQVYYELVKDVCYKYGYPFLDEPPFYEEFILPNKNSKGGFFQKLQSVLVFESNTYSQYGDQQLFNSMERAKLCYIMLKQKFKINYLNKLGCDIMMLNNDFEKVGKPGEKVKVEGGLKGTFVQDRWYNWALFSDVQTIRSYFGDVVAFEIVVKTAIIFFLLINSAPTIMLFIFEQLYGQGALVVTDLIEIGIFVTSFCVFILYIEEQEQRFATTYSDKKPSRIFLNQFRGPYIRNPMTDELNQYQQESGIITLVKNFACLIVFSVLALIFGAIFYGCRMLLVQIQPRLYHYQTTWVSLAHIISYSLYFMVGDVFKIKLYGYIVNGMIFIKNPPTDELERGQRGYFTFYYLLTLQCIPIFFYYILEPFQGNSCYNNNCNNAFTNYIYARFLFNLAMAMLSFIQVFLLGYGKRTVQNTIGNIGDIVDIVKGEGKKAAQQKNNNTYHGKLRKMILAVIKQNKKPPYEQGLTRDILSLFAYCFYCTEFTIAGVVAMMYIITIYIVMRTNLMYQTRRPINKSQTIISFRQSLYAIYFCGLLFNIWINTFLAGFTEQNYIFAINMAPTPITASSIFFVKLAITFILFLLFSVLGVLVRSLTLALSPKTVINRQRNKYKQYIRTVGGPKTKEVKFYTIEPIKTIFRIFSPDVKPDEQLDLLLNRMNKYQYDNIINKEMKGIEKEIKKTANAEDKPDKNRSEARLQMSSPEL